MIENYKQQLDEIQINMNIDVITKWCAEIFKIDNCKRSFVNNFLRKCNYDRNICKQKLTRYFMYKKIYSEYLQASDLKYDHDFRSFCLSVYSLYMPTLTSTGHRVYIDKITDDENLFDISKIMKYYSMQTDIRFTEDESDNGDIILFDCNHVNLLNFIAFTPYFIKCLILVFEVYPLDLKLLILVNTGKLMAILLNAVKLFFPQSFKQKFHIYAKGSENFLKYVDTSVLPLDYGGKLPSLELLRDNWIGRLYSHHEWFNETNRRINMSDFKSEEINPFGVNGSFRDILID